MASEAITTLVDSNVVLDVLSDDERWGEWSTARLSEAQDAGTTIINPLVYAEVSIRVPDMALLDSLVAGFGREALPWEGGYLAGRAFLDYRRRGGHRVSPLPDFYIGAHASVRGHRLLTRDARRFRTYFPDVDLVAPA